MQIPNADLAVVDFDKVIGYLLNLEHPDGAGKAKFFLAAGFRSNQWELLAQSLRTLLVAPHRVRTVDSVHGRKYIVEGTINTPDGGVARIRSVWIDDGDGLPRLVTAYPA